MSKRKSHLFEIHNPLPRNAFTRHAEELERLQGNILKGHGRDAEVHLFLTFESGKQKEAKQFLAEFAPNVTSAAGQREQTLRFRRSRMSELFATVGLSADGYRYLRLRTSGFSLPFRRGMKDARVRLADPHSNRWEPKFQKDLHAIVLLAHDDLPELKREVRSLRARVSSFAGISTELGRKMCDGAGRTIEHFGFVDGRSQPLFFQEDVEKDSPRRRCPRHWNPSAGPNLVLIKDPLGRSPADCGTYFVFRKLEQNVQRFRRHVAALADALQLRGEARQLADALVVGRFPDGTPVALHKRPRGRRTPSNNFDYAKADNHGNRCPFAAHIRKTNPRGEVVNGETAKAHRMRRVARRGMAYGDPTPPGEDLDALPKSGVGLLFQCCQADLESQFEFLQMNWANNEDLPRTGTGMDPMIGQSDSGFRPLEFPTRWGQSGTTSFRFDQFVTMKGGEYFFMPSLTFLRSLR
jgi:Dyp-type peroxidase family